MFVPEAIHCVVARVEDVFKLMLAGASNRTTSRTNMNEHSSRSHTIFSLVVNQSFEDDEGVQVTKRGKLNLVDLAGSEKWSAHNGLHGQKRIKEMASINQSLSVLGKCISALTQPNSALHIPFRDSKLTRLLQDSLGGNCKTAFITTVSPSELAYDETCSTLRFADRAKHVVVHTKVNEIHDDHKVVIRKLMEENKKLRLENQKLRQVASKARARRSSDASSPEDDPPAKAHSEGRLSLSPRTLGRLGEAAPLSQERRRLTVDDMIFLRGLQAGRSMSPYVNLQSVHTVTIQAAQWMRRQWPTPSECTSPIVPEQPPNTVSPADLDAMVPDVTPLACVLLSPPSSKKGRHRRSVSTDDLGALREILDMEEATPVEFEAPPCHEELVGALAEETLVEFSVVLEKEAVAEAAKLESTRLMEKCAKQTGKIEELTAELDKQELELAEVQDLMAEYKAVNEVYVEQREFSLQLSSRQSQQIDALERQCAELRGSLSETLDSLAHEAGVEERVCRLEAELLELQTGVAGEDEFTSMLESTLRAGMLENLLAERAPSHTSSQSTTPVSTAALTCDIPDAPPQIAVGTAVVQRPHKPHRRRGGRRSSRGVSLRKLSARIDVSAEVQQAARYFFGKGTDSDEISTCLLYTSPSPRDS
eukprot:TRINITY_DN4621_c0_g1_i11.p1 TRINITY_DN4621_c0_g1~~TRINITY_DN4621_c0_g1_i11.p1  ORF type:complete len:649 (+),score=177.92 TRINITY_DN4621_c0_g1_i11:650-2596(+)